MRIFRGIIFALALAGAANAQGVSHDAGNHTDSQHSAPQPKADTPPVIPVTVQNDIKRIARALETVSQKRPSAEETEQAKRNLAAQEKIAHWAPYVFWAAFGEFIVTVFGVFLVWRTLVVAGDEVSETRKTAKAAQDQVTVAKGASARNLRPYVSLSIDARRWPNAPVIGTTGQQSYVWNRYSVILTIKNTGRTWAQNVRVQREVVDTPTGDAWQGINWNLASQNALVLAPGEEISLQFGDIPRPALSAIASGQRLVFYVAWLTYDDPLAEPPSQRQTRLYRTLTADAEEGVAFTWMPANNCADDGCQ